MAVHSGSWCQTVVVAAILVACVIRWQSEVRKRQKAWRHSSTATSTVQHNDLSESHIISSQISQYLELQDSNGWSRSMETKTTLCPHVDSIRAWSSLLSFTTYLSVSFLHTDAGESCLLKTSFEREQIEFATCQTSWQPCSKQTNIQNLMFCHKCYSTESCVICYQRRWKMSFFPDIFWLIHGFIYKIQSTVKQQELCHLWWFGATCCTVPVGIVPFQGSLLLCSLKPCTCAVRLTRVQRSIKHLTSVVPKWNISISAVW